MAGNGKSGRKPYKNTSTHKANMKIKGLEKDLGTLASILGSTDSNVENLDAKVERLRGSQRILSEEIDVLYEITESDRKQPNRRRRSNFSLMRSLLYSRKTRRGVRAVAIYGTVIFAGAYALSLLLQ